MVALASTLRALISVVVEKALSVSEQRDTSSECDIQLFNMDHFSWHPAEIRNFKPLISNCLAGVRVATSATSSSGKTTTRRRRRLVGIDLWSSFELTAFLDTRRQNNLISMLVASY